MFVVVRRANRDDADAVAKYAMALIEQHVGYDSDRYARFATEEGAAWFYRDQADADGVSLLVAEIDGDVLGFAYLTFEARNYVDMSENAAKLHDIYLDAAARGAGAGNALMDAVKSEAKRLGAEKILLMVGAKNEPAQRFFDNAGFRPTMHEMMFLID